MTQLGLDVTKPPYALCTKTIVENLSDLHVRYAEQKDRLDK